jgi:DNA-3-methyladenine glycosylase II
LSGAKARTFHAAAATFDGFPQVEFEALSDQEAFARLTHIPGIGPWTAQVYLLSVLRRPDAWPAGDLALQVAAQNLFGLTKRPDSKTMLRLAEPWRPFRAAAARLLWSHYRGLKGMNQHII